MATQVAHLAWTDEVALKAATDQEAWDAVVLLDFRPNAYFLRVARTSDMSRETAFAILDHLEAERLGREPIGETATLVGFAFGHIDQWTRPAPRCSPRSSTTPPRSPRARRG